MNAKNVAVNSEKMSKLTLQKCCASPIILSESTATLLGLVEYDLVLTGLSRVKR